MFITLTVNSGQLTGRSIEIVVDKIFGISYSEVLQSTVVMSDAGSSLCVKETVNEIKLKLQAIKSELK